MGSGSLLRPDAERLLPVSGRRLKTLYCEEVVVGVVHRRLGLALALLGRHLSRTVIVVLVALFCTKAIIFLSFMLVLFYVLRILFKSWCIGHFIYSFVLWENNKYMHVILQLKPLKW